MLSERATDYCSINSSTIPAYLVELERETHIKMVNPRMLSGELQGRVLSMISKIQRPKRILEIGTFTGYSCLCLAEGLREKGCLDTIEVNREMAPIISKYINKSPFEGRINLLLGDALKIIGNLKHTYDLVFLDAGKEDYIKFYELIFPILNPGGVILADNVLWSGKVYLDPEDPTARQIHLFNRHVHSDKRVDTVILPLRDGLSLIRKL